MLQEYVGLFLRRWNLENFTQYDDGYSQQFALVMDDLCVGFMTREALRVTTIECIMKEYTL